MLKRLIKKEILEHLMSLRFALACFLCLIVVLCGLSVRCRDFSQLLDDLHQGRAMEDTRLANITEPWGLPWGGLTVHAQPNPLKVFVEGMEEASSRAWRVSAIR